MAHGPLSSPEATKGNRLKGKGNLANGGGLLRFDCTIPVKRVIRQSRMKTNWKVHRKRQGQVFVRNGLESKKERGA
jgi:hypothetical protein